LSNGDSVGALGESPATGGLEPGGYLDTLLLKRDKLKTRRSCGKLFSRAKVGMLIPGDYYLITFTSSPVSPKIENTWYLLKKWLHRHFPVMVWLYVITDEGFGVIHMIVRLPKGHLKIDINVLRGYWEKIHKAKFVNIKAVYNQKGLANYLSDQRRRKGMAVELSSQETIKRWRMSKGWVPKAFMVDFGRYWYKTGSHLDETTQDDMLRDWVTSTWNNGDYQKAYPCIENETVKWSEIKYV
jgi:hypothetical protein